MATAGRARRGATTPTYFTVDGGYLRVQAWDAIVSFLAPLLGIYAVATAKKRAARASSQVSAAEHADNERPLATGCD